MRWDVGIDLGTENVRMAVWKEGPVLDAAAALAFREGRDTPICGGDAARKLYGRTCEGMSVVSPLRDGVLENNFIADRMFRWLYHQLETVNRKRRFNVLITCAPFSRPVQQEALLTAAIDAGAATAALIRSDAAVAVGAGMDLNAPEAKLLVDVGAGKLSATLFTFGRVAAYGYLPYGMKRIDERIQRIIRTDYGYRIGRTAANEIKHTLGTAQPVTAPTDIIMHMTGFSLADRLPRNFDVETRPVLEACEDVVRELTGLCASVVDNAPEELSADLNDAGAVLAGGGAELAGLDKRIGDALGIPCRLADVPSTCGIRGLYRIMENPDDYKAAFMDQKVSAAWR
ncbi:MAG: rod shape-determining protein [Candidatus Faecivicinus sp.]